MTLAAGGIPRGPRAEAKAQIFALEGEIEVASIAAEAELDIASLSGSPQNRFAGAGEHLRVLEAEREAMIRRQRGVQLVDAIAQFDALNTDIAELREKYREAQGTVDSLKGTQTIMRWVAAPRYAKGCGVHSFWTVLATFLASEAPWDKSPVQVGDVYSTQLPDQFRFTEEERSAIRQWVAVNGALEQLSWGLNSLSTRREKLLQSFPALRSLPASA